MNNEENNNNKPFEPENKPSDAEKTRVSRVDDDLEIFEEYERRWSRAVENRADAYGRSGKKEEGKNGVLSSHKNKKREKQREKLEKEKEAERIEFANIDSDLDYNPGKTVRGLRHRRRTHHDSGYSCLAAMLYAAFILGVSMFCAGFIIVCANEVFAFVKPELTSIVEIDETDSYAVVAEKLSDAGLIDHPWLFRLYCKVANPEFITGKYELDASLDYNAMKKKMSHISTSRETVWVTIPEGYTAKQIADALEEKKVCTAADFMNAIETGEFDYEFLPERNEKAKVRLEGYLFPDTYQFYVSDDPVNVIKKFLNNFEVRFTEKLKRRMADVDMSMEDIMIIASMIEREAKYDSERPVIASVILNRLAKPSSYPYLNVDATIQYLVGRKPEPEDMELDDPYNTYLYKGLIPGPICNPGIDAVTSVLYAEDTSYYYYVARADGTHIFSETYDEHQKAIREAEATFTENN